jgi:hypothetical protein
MNMSPLKLTCLAALAMGLAAARLAGADSGLCANGSSCDGTPVEAAHVDAQRSKFFSALQVAGTGASHATQRRVDMSDQEFFSFSGVGAIVCTVNGKQTTATAFLVGAFDIGVTVAHTFTSNGQWTEPTDCVYTSTDSVGQIRERIPVSYIKAQWQAEADAFGQPAKDFAVVRLSEPSKFAQRTMPLGKFSGAASPVLMIGFKSDINTDTLKRKSRGMVYGRRASGIATAGMAGFVHDMDSRGIAAGAPVIDERTGVIIGLHTLSTSSTTAPRNTMITMNEWLEKTLRFEMQIETTSKAN